MSDSDLRQRLRRSLLDLWASYVAQGTPELFDPFRELLEHLDDMDGLGGRST